jgi:hypothetical protein
VEPITGKERKMNYTYDLVKDKNGYKLYKRNDGKFVVIQFSPEKHQVYSAMPGDQPPGSGMWYAGNTSAGISYVSNGYSKSYAQKMFNRLSNV